MTATHVVTLTIEGTDVALHIQDGVALFGSDEIMEPANVLEAAIEAEGMMLDRAAAVREWIYLARYGDDAAVAKQPRRPRREMPNEWWLWWVCLGWVMGVVAARLF